MQLPRLQMQLRGRSLLRRRQLQLSRRQQRWRRQQPRSRLQRRLSSEARQLLRQLLEYECVVANTAPLLPLYRTIMSCCFPQDCAWSFAAIRRFGVLMATAEGRKSVHQCSLSIQATDTTRRCLEEAVRKVHDYQKTLELRVRKLEVGK